MVRPVVIYFGRTASVEDNFHVEHSFATSMVAKVVPPLLLSYLRNLKFICN